MIREETNAGRVRVAEMLNADRRLANSDVLSVEPTRRRCRPTVYGVVVRRLTPFCRSFAACRCANAVG